MAREFSCLRTQVCGILALFASNPIIAHRAVIGFSFTPSTYPQHPSRTLFPSHASRTHVKAPQADFPTKPDNSLGSTRDSPSERPSRKKRRSSQGRAPKRHRGLRAVRGPPKPSHDQLSSMLIQSESRDQGPKGSIETKTSSTSMPRAMGEAAKTSGQIPWLHVTVTEAHRG